MIKQISPLQENKKTLIQLNKAQRNTADSLQTFNSSGVKINAPKSDSGSLNQNIYGENKKEETPAFKGPVTMGLGLLRGINNSPALGACAVDLCSMVIPRTSIEFKNRGTQAGIEAAFREGGSCLVHACIGLIGLLASVIISGGFNKTHGVKAQKIFASGDTIKNMAHLWEDAHSQSDKFFSGFLGNLSGLNGTSWNKISEGAKSEITENLVTLADKTAQLAKAKGKDKSALKREIKNIKNMVLSKITQDTGAQASFKLSELKNADGKIVKGISGSIQELVDNAVVLNNSFKTQTPSKMSEFVKSLTKNKAAGTILGLAIAAAICVSIQPLNKYLTKKRTGQDGFVGVDDKQANKSEKFKAVKNFAGIAFPIFAVSTIGTTPSNFLSSVQFNSMKPTINQFKLLYGGTIGSRFLAARDQNELRESIIKDTLGFTNWLILGGMVSKGVARLIGGKELINNPAANETAKKGIKSLFKWLTKASVKTYDEILLPAVKDKITPETTFAQLYRNADKAVKSNIHKAAIAQIAGYLYSGLVLGVGIAKLNIFITKMLHSKNKASKNMQESINYCSKLSNLKTEKLSSVFEEFNK